MGINRMNKSEELLRLSSHFADETIDAQYKNKLNDKGTDADMAYRIIKDQLMVEGNARQNLATFCQTYMEPQAVRIISETLDKNAIDKSLIAFAADKLESVRAIVAEKQDEFTKDEAYSEEEKIILTLDSASGDKTVDSATRDNVIGVLTEIPTGVRKWYDDQDLVETSSNMGMLAYNGETGRLEISSLSRSFIAEKLDEVTDDIEKVAGKYSADYMVKDSFPEWTPNFDSRLKAVFESIYLNTFGEPADTLSIHAGLECGYFAKKFLEAGIETDFLAIGPTIIGAHTTGERLYWPSVPKIVELLLHVMAEIDIINAQPVMAKARNKCSSTRHVHINCQCMK